MRNAVRQKTSAPARLRLITRKMNAAAKTMKRRAYLRWLERGEGFQLREEMWGLRITREAALSRSVL